MAADRRPNLRQLASRLGLSATTVSRALKDGPEVHPETIRRVKAAAHAAGYIPNLHGRALRTGLTHNLTAILPMETRDYLSDIAKLPLIEGMTIAARERGFSLNIFSTTPDEDPEQNLMNVLQSGSADGVIITRMTAGDTRIPLLAQRRVPFITFGRSGPDIDHAFVDIDNTRIAYEATSLLIARGHRRVAFQLLMQEDEYSTARLKGYVQALRENDLSFDKAIIGHDDFTIDANERWADRLLRLPDPPRAFVCANELGLLGTLSALRRNGLVVGQDVSLAVRDNTRIANYLSIPLIVHVVDMATVGKNLVEGLIQQIEHPGEAFAHIIHVGVMQEIDA